MGNQEQLTSTIVDADKYARALEAPQLRLEGRLYTGRVLSIDEWQPYGTRAQIMQDALNVALKKLEQAQTAADPNRGAVVSEIDKLQRNLDDLMRSYFRAVFPQPPRWALWRHDPLPALMQHPSRNAILKAFFGHQVRQIKKLGAHLTDGIDSPS